MCKNSSADSSSSLLVSYRSKQSRYTWTCLETCIFLVCSKTYLFISEPNSSMEGDEGCIFSKPPDWKPWFLLVIKTKQNCQNKKYNAIFQPFIRISGPIPQVKKICIDQWLGTFWILDITPAKRGVIFKNSKISMSIWKNMEVQPKTSTQKISILNLGKFMS